MSDPKIEGSCHCGSVKWTYQGPDQQALACSCTVCRRYGALWAYGAKGVNATTEGETQHYAHGDKSIEFHFCKNCGCLTHYVGATPDEDGTTRLAVNLRMTNDPQTVADYPMRHWDGFDKWKMMPADERRVRDMWY
jgi:hypothetical protein